MSVELLELRSCALVDRLGFVWASRGWIAPSTKFLSRLKREGASMSEAGFRVGFPEADLNKLPKSSKDDPARAT